MSKTLSGPKGRVFGLDIFRAFAILLVVSVHGSYMLNGSPIENFPFFSMIDGVDMFFVLSGFLIGGILLKEINITGSLSGKQLLNFWKRRWFRTLPAYYLILLANYIFVIKGIIREDLTQFNWKFIFFLQNFSQPFEGFFWESWSLSIEEWFYIASPILLLPLSRIMQPKRSFLLVTGIMILFSVMYRIKSFSPVMNDYVYGQLFRKVVLLRLDSVAYGLFAAWMLYYYKPVWDKIKFASLITGIGIIVFVLNFQIPITTFYKQVFHYTLTPVSAMLLLPFANSINFSKGAIVKAITWISKISYSMYLINLALVAEVIGTNFPPEPGIDGILKYIAYWIIVILGSSLLYTYFEKPVLELRDRKTKKEPHLSGESI